MPIWTLARKDFRVVWRDRRALIVLMVMPLLLILVLGLSLGEGFGQKPDDRLRISVVDLDKGFVEHDKQSGADITHHWSTLFQEDLARTAGIRVERIATLEEAEQLVKRGRRAAVWVFRGDFSEKLTQCSFLEGGVNPLDRDGVDLSRLESELLRDPTQLTASSIIAQVAQGTTLRVVLPWMIGRAFDQIGHAFDKIGNLGALVQGELKRLFPSYDLTATTWAGLTRSTQNDGHAANIDKYQPPEGNGLFNRGAARYQILVPTYLVTFAYFLVLIVGRLFVSERQQGTMTRLRAAPLSRFQILTGKFLPTYFLSVLQGLFLLGAGKLAFAMSWGDKPLWLLPVVLSTSLSAMGLALVVAALSRTESQVAIYGTLVVLALAGASGSLLGDRELMPTAMQHISMFTPQAWALDAYRQLLANPAGPNLPIVAECCGVLTCFGVGLMLIGWKLLRLDAPA